ncbi:multinuclear nonheme iron-dependent oxidase [Lederbergia lenta]|uniref:multinuclear nonheme iron-dependent oxidase n=1 Tax=Lederbergia lenta TaxID=1467 RepID=UPI00203E8559|nr:DUF692 family multinuclear iron-containing protein [Lederbergia lenta]MCM3109552.1 DUF692 family protein [Lederbergia lenta]
MGMELGCNYSEELLALINQKHIDVDWIKLSREDKVWEELPFARPIKPVHLHILPNAGQPNLDKLNWDDINRAIEACGAPHIAIHLSSLPRYWINEAVSKEEILESLVKGVTYCKEQISVDLLIENVPYYDFKGTLRPATDPDVIEQVCQQVGVGFMLDLAHLRVASWHRNEDLNEYLFAMPLHQVREIHVSGPAMFPGVGLRDRHLEMQEIDYDLLKLTLQHTHAKYLTLEYGGTGPKMEWRSDKTTLKNQLLQLRKIIQNSIENIY